MFLTKPVSYTASAKLEMCCDAFANKKGRGHPWWRQTVGPRRFVLAFLAVALRCAGIRTHAFLLTPFGINNQAMDVVLTAALEILESLDETLLEHSTINNVLHVATYR